MSTDREIALPIDAFLGVDRQVSREDITDFHSYATQNLWEKTVGELETRGGSTSLASGWPSNVVGMDNEFRIFKKNLNHARLVSLHCNYDSAPALPTVALAWASDAGGGWMNDVVAGGTTLRSEPLAIWVRYCGYGVDYSVRTLATAITGYTTTGPLRLDVTASNLSNNSNITGIEIYAEIECGATSVVGATYNSSFAYVGYYDFVVNGATTKQFYYAPISRKSTSSASGEIGELERTFTLEAGTQVGSTLESGKTYYVAVLPQHFKWNGTASSCAVEYRQPDIVYATEIKPITLPEGYTSITVSSISPSTVTALIAIGESPQTLVPYGICNPINTSDSTSITSYPKNNPGTIGVQFTSDTNCNLRFIGSDFCAYDMLSRIDDDGTKSPVFLSRGTAFNLTAYTGFIFNNGAAVEIPIPYRIGHMGYRGKYRYAQHGEVAYFVNGDRPSDSVITTSGAYGLNSQRLHNYSGNYMVTDGYGAGLVCMQKPWPQTAFPFFTEIGRYQESIILAGGKSLSSSLLVNSIPESTNFMYYSQTSNPLDFTVPADPTMFQYIRVEQGGEPINGIGLFTTTTSDEGLDSRLVISKRNSLWIIGNLPAGADADGTFMRNISAKIGAANSLVFAYTPIGTIIAGSDNVYVLRESGEPVPIGDPISPILKKADMTRAVACYHDEQYKLAFYHPDYAGTDGYNNVEFWLDIKKMKQLQGKPNWNGPMVGRAVDFVMVEDLSGDGDSYEDARDRIVVDRENLRVYKADVTPGVNDTQVLDFATAVTSLIETKDYQIGEQDKNWNKLITRQYWKLKTNKTSGTPLSATETTWVDGSQVESKAITAYGLAATTFDEQPQKVNPVFPSSRYRGRTVRKRLSTTDRVSVGGFVIHYRVERRRI